MNAYFKIVTDRVPASGKNQPCHSYLRFTPLSTLLQLKRCIRRYFEKSVSGIRKTIASAEHGFLALGEWRRSSAFAAGASPPMGPRLRRNEGQGQKGCFRFQILNQPRGYNFS